MPASLTNVIAVVFIQWQPLTADVTYALQNWKEEFVHEIGTERCREAREWELSKIICKFYL